MQTTFKPHALTTEHAVNAYPPGGANAYAFRLKIRRVYRDEVWTDRWYIEWRSQRLSHTGTWDHLPDPDLVDIDQWCAVHEYDENVALARAAAIAPTLTIMGHSIAEVWASEQESITKRTAAGPS